MLEEPINQIEPNTPNNCRPCHRPYKFKYLHPIFWERVLPAVYDDTLTFYELLSKLIYKINEFICLANRYEEVVINFEEIDQMLEELNERIDELNEMLPDIDELPTDGSNNLVYSNGIYDFVMAVTALLRQIDLTPTDGSTNLVDSNGIYDAIQAAKIEAMGGYPDYSTAFQNYLTFNTPRTIYVGPAQNATNGFGHGGVSLAAQWNEAQTIIAVGGNYEFHINTELTSGSMFPLIPLYLDSTLETPLNLPNKSGVEEVYNNIGIVLNWSANVKRECALIHHVNGNFSLRLNLPIYWAPTGYDTQGNRYQDAATVLEIPVFLAASQEV